MYNRRYSQAVKIEQGTTVTVVNDDHNCFAVGDAVKFDMFDPNDGTYGFFGVSRHDGHPCRQWLYPSQFEQRPEENA